jgi:hypothetical protein
MKGFMVDNLPTSLVDLSTDNTIIGMPTMVMFPAGNYCFKVSEDRHTITIPRRGDYKDVAPEIFADSDEKFEICDEKNGVVYLAALTKVLFAANKYPDLEEGQFFAPMFLLVDEDTISIVGQVLSVVSDELVADLNNKYTFDESESEDELS